MSRGGHNKTHDSIEGSRRIDIRFLQKEGFFKQGQELKGNRRVAYNMQWSNRWDKCGSCNVEYKDNEHVTIVYTITDKLTEEKEDVRQMIQLDYVKTNFGDRAYFICPTCYKRTTTLCFRGQFKCRICSSLNYSSSQMNHDMFTKPDKRIETILKKLKHKCDNINDVYHVSKPKRMRHITYENLIKQLHHWQDIRNMGISEALKRLNRGIYKILGIKP